MNYRPIAALALCLFTGAVALAEPGIRDPQMLLPQARWARPDVLEAWKAEQAWMRDRFRVITEGETTFLRVGESPAVLSTMAPVPLNAKELALSFRARLAGLQAGAQSWDVPRVTISFFDRFGNEVADGWAAGWQFDQDVPQWATYGRRYTLPPGARMAQITIAHKPVAGTFDIADLKLFDPADAPPGVDVPALGAPVNVTKPLGPDAKRDSFAILDASRPLGANVDESKVQVTIHVRSDAGPGGDGSEARPMASLPEAIDQAKAHLNHGKGVRVAVAAGTYRLTTERQMLHAPEQGLQNMANAAIDLTDWTPQGRDAVLVIEGVGGQAVLSGAEAWEPSQWTLVDPDKRIYSHPWTDDWGFHHAGYYFWNDLRLHRRELVLLNGKRMDMAILEDYTFADPQGRVYDTIGNVIREEKLEGKPAYTYVGWRGIEQLKPGEYGVAERNDHPGGDRLYLRLPEGMSTLEGASVEVGRTRTIMMINGKNNLVLRNLTFQHCASHFNDYFGKAPIDTGDWLSPKDTHNWLIEDCVFRQNNGMGLRFHNVAHVDVRNVLSEDNGAQGIDASGVRRARFNNVQALRNFHRARPSGYHGHGGGGMSLAGEDITFTDCKFNDNYGFGFREDVFGSRIVHERNEFNRNQEGFFYEISWGPVLLKDSQIIGNERRGFFLLNVRDVTVDNCEIRDNGVGMSFYNMPGRSTPLELASSAWGHDGAPIQMTENLVVRNTVVTASKPEQKLVERTHEGGSIDLYHLLIREEYRGENNRFHNPSDPTMFELGTTWGDRGFRDFEAWQAATGEGDSSRWAADAEPAPTVGAAVTPGD